MTVQDKLDQLRTLLARATDVYSAYGVLEWDQETYMPPGGVEARGDQMGRLLSLYHEFLTDDVMGTLLGALEPASTDLDPDSDDACLVRWARREYDKRVKVPAELVMEIGKATSVATEVWKQARETNDFALFEPHLKQIIELKMQYAEALGSESGNPYDALMDYYDPGLTAEYVGEVFGALRPELVELVDAIIAHQDAVDDSVLKQRFDVDKQIAFNEEVAAAIGYDFTRGRLDSAVHPFTSGFSRDDVRITTRIMEDDPISGLMSTIHETGHALYELNVSESLYRTPLGTGSSMSIHESQSRYFENVMGRSRAFWTYWYPRLQERFAPQFDDVDMETFYKAINKSEPSLIRVEADEVTYGLHIMLRFELENEIFNGKVRVEDLPNEWNDRMEAYLGIRPPDDTTGVLQDTHWSWGLFGYFPDYLLGSILSSQLWEKMQADIPDVEDRIANGEFGVPLAWQIENIHQHGSKFTFPEMVERATGQSLNWQPYIGYLRQKYGDIYGL